MNEKYAYNKLSADNGYARAFVDFLKVDILFTITFLPFQNLSRGLGSAIFAYVILYLPEATIKNGIRMLMEKI